MRHSRLSLPLSLLAIAVLLGAPALLSNCGGGKSPSPSGRKVPRVVLITIDTLRADRLHCYGYERPTSPNLDRLASEGILFENAQVPRGSTWPSLTTILTGKYPITHGVRSNRQNMRAEHLYITEIFQEAAYTTAGFITNMFRAPYRGFDTGPEKFFVPMTHAEADRAATDAARAWLRENREEDFFLWVHYIDPHKPYSPEPEFDQFTDPNFEFQIPAGFVSDRDKQGRKIPEERTPLDDYLQHVTEQRIELTDEELAHIQGLYDGEILAVDHEIGRLLDALDELGLTEDTLVVFTSDHGEEMYDRHHYFYHANSVYEGVLHVPMMMRLPGTIPKGVREATLVEASDVAPTIFDLAEIGTDERFDGATLRPLIMGEGYRQRSFQSFGEDAADLNDAAFGEFAERLDGKQPIYTVRRGDWKLIYNPDGIAPGLAPYRLKGETRFTIGREELYNLKADPGETQNLIEDEKERAKELRVLADKYRDLLAVRAGAADPMTYDQLLNAVVLGYVFEDAAREDARKLFDKSPEEFDQDLQRRRKGKE